MFTHKIFIMKTKILILVLSVFLFWGCGSNKKDGNIDHSDTLMVFKEGGDERKVKFKSAIIEMESKTMGFSQKMKLYLDDYGKKQLTEVSMEMLGKKVVQYALSDGEFMYSYNLETRQGTKSRVDTNSFDNINFNAITKDIADKFKIKKTGTEKVLNRECEVYTLEFEAAKLKGTYWIWQGIPLKSESKVAGLGVVIEATAVETDVEIDPQKFMVPDGITFVEKTAMHN